MKIIISGASDDLVEIDGDIREEFNTDNWNADLVAPDGSQMTVFCWYDANGTWAVGVAQTEEDHQMPAWPIAIGQAAPMNPDNPGYSAMLTIEAPDGTKLVNVKPQRDDE